MISFASSIGPQLLEGSSCKIHSFEDKLLWKREPARYAAWRSLGEVTDGPEQIARRFSQLYEKIKLRLNSELYVGRNLFLARALRLKSPERAKKEESLKFLAVIDSKRLSTPRISLLKAEVWTINCCQRLLGH